MLKKYRDTEYGERAKRKYRETHAEQLKNYQKEYYLNVTKQKRAMKRASLQGHQVSKNIL